MKIIRVRSVFVVMRMMPSTVGAIKRQYLVSQVNLYDGQLFIQSHIRIMKLSIGSRIAVR